MIYENVCQSDYHGQTCQKVPKQHCQKIPEKICAYVDVIKKVKKAHKQCQIQLHEYVTVHETQYHPYCEHFPVEKCFMVYKHQCNRRSYGNCQKVPVQECKTFYTKKCQDFVEVPVNKEKSFCVWPEFREQDDPNCYH